MAIGTNNNHALAFHIAGQNTEKMRIDTSGRVGIGTTSMGSLYAGGDDLVIGNGGASNQGMTIYTGSSTQGIIAFADGFTGAAQQYAGYLLYDHSTDSFRVATTGQERMRIDSSGRLLLNSGTDVRIELGTTGTTGTNNRNHLRGDGANLKYNTASGGIHAFEQNGTERLRIDSSGRLLVGTTSVGAADKFAIHHGSDAANIVAITGADQSTEYLGLGIESGVPTITAGGFTTNSASLVFKTASSGTETERLRITSSGVVTVKNSSVGEIDALTSASTITPDFAASNNFSVTLGTNATLANPSNLTAGQSGVIAITQDGTGSRTLAYGSKFKFAGGTAPTLTTTASAVDILTYYVESTSRITAQVLLNVS
jgi:hypothetical protein